MRMDLKSPGNAQNRRHLTERGDEYVYSDLWGNLWGQICPQFAAIWWGLCLVFIPVFDWMRYAVAGGERPRYRVI